MTHAKTSHAEVRRRRRSRAVCEVPAWSGLAIVVAALVCLLITGFAGIDFGTHWDDHVQLSLVNRTIRSGTFLPTGIYNWPAMTYLLSVGSVFFRVIARLNTSDQLSGGEFYLQARGVFLVVTSLGGVWTYLALRRRAGELGAAFGGALYLLSFQLAYHARWIAPDAIMASFTALFVLLLLIAWDAPESRWRAHLPAVGAALATSCKYQGAVLLLPIAIMYLDRWRSNKGPGVLQVKQALGSVGIFVAVFVVLNPGSVLQPAEFFNDLQYENEHYRTTHGLWYGVRPHDITSPLSYLWHEIKFVVLSLPSPSPVLSVIVIGFSIVGAAVALRRDGWFAAALLTPGLVVVFYFATLHVFQVRNFLLLLPFLAFFAGIGADKILLMVRARGAVAFVAGVLAVILIYNAVWLEQAAGTVGQSRAWLVGQTSAYVRDHPGTRFVVSAPLARAFIATKIPLPRNARRSGRADVVLALFSQVRDAWRGQEITLRHWPATDRSTFTTIGPKEVDFNFYPTWEGKDRVLVLSDNDLVYFGLTRRELDVRS